MPQLGWEVYKEKQEVMPRITKGHFPFDWNEYFNGPRSAMHPGGGRGRQCLSDQVHNLWSHTDFKTEEYHVKPGKVPILCSNATE